MFIGRKQELKQLAEFQKRRIAGLIVCSGRRRIGKSTLIEHFGKTSHFLEFYGLPPKPGLSNQDQLDHFSKQISNQLNMPDLKFDNWHTALTTLAGLTAKGEHVILLDEISWMAGKDKTFTGILKGIWDTQFKINPELILVLCGSVTSWIQENILEDKGFMGRVSLDLKLEELPLPDINQFWSQSTQTSASDKFKILCTTGGIPRYLEEINHHQPAEHNIKRLCFSPSGMLFNEFDKIFKDIFESQADNYKSIVATLIHQNLTTENICNKLGIEQSGSFNKKLKILEQCGFIARDYAWQGDKKNTKQSQYRLKDNYLRFYLKYIEPKKDRILQNLYQDIHLTDFDDWYSIMGLQFENLVINNLPTVIKQLEIPPASLLSAAPYTQSKTQRQDACQIDLLIQAKFSCYPCEIKFKQNIGTAIIDDMLQKIERLNLPKTMSVRPVLIYQGELSRQVKQADFFSHLIRFEDLLIK